IRGFAQDASRREREDAEADQGRRPQTHASSRGHRAVDDRRGAEAPGDHERLAAREGRKRLRTADQRGEPAARTVPRDAEDDEEGWKPARRGRQVQAEYVWDAVVEWFGLGSQVTGLRNCLRTQD